MVSGASTKNRGRDSPKKEYSSTPRKNPSKIFSVTWSKVSASIPAWLEEAPAAWFSSCALDDLTRLRVGRGWLGQLELSQLVQPIAGEFSSQRLSERLVDDC